MKLFSFIVLAKLERKHVSNIMININKLIEYFLYSRLKIQMQNIL